MGQCGTSENDTDATPPPRSLCRAPAWIEGGKAEVVETLSKSSVSRRAPGGTRVSMSSRPAASARSARRTCTPASSATATESRAAEAKTDVASRPGSGRTTTSRQGSRNTARRTFSSEVTPTCEGTSAKRASAHAKGMQRTSRPRAPPVSGTPRLSARGKSSTQGATPSPRSTRVRQIPCVHAANSEGRWPTLSKRTAPAPKIWAPASARASRIHAPAASAAGASHASRRGRR